MDFRSVEWSSFVLLLSYFRLVWLLLVAICS